jgi:hypothetical protein
MTVTKEKEAELLQVTHMNIEEEALKLLEEARTHAKQGAQAFLRISRNKNPKLSQDPNALERLEVTFFIQRLFTKLPNDTGRLLGSLRIAQRTLAALKTTDLESYRPSDTHSIVQEENQRREKLVAEASALVEHYKRELMKTGIVDTLNESQCWILDNEFLSVSA